MNEGLRAAVEAPAGQLPLFVQARDAKAVAKVLAGERGITARLDTDSPEVTESLGYDHKTRRQTDDEVWDQKLNEAGIPGRYEKPGAPPSEWSSLREDIARNGLKEPVRMAGAPAWSAETGSEFPEGTVLDGYHRLAAIAEDQPDSWMQVHWDQGPTKTGALDKR